MYTLELDFDQVEEFLEDIDTFIGAHETIDFNDENIGSIENYIKNYVRSGPENYMKIVGTNSDWSNEYGNYKVLKPSSAELHRDNGKLAAPGIPPAYMSDMENIHEFLEENRDIDKITAGYLTTPEIARSQESKKKAVERQKSMLQERWPEITWKETDGDTINTWTYKKGEIEVLSGDIRKNVEKDDFDQTEAIRYVMSEAPFENKIEFKRAQDDAIIAASVKRNPGKEEEMINEIEQTNVPATRKEETSQD